MNTRPGPPTHDVSTRLAALEGQIAYLVARERKKEELLTEMTPIAREMMAVAATKLSALESDGYFAFGAELVRLGERVVTGFSTEDVRRLADAIVGILETIRALTQPKVLAIATDASDALERANEAEPVGLFGAMRATSDDEVQKGMGVMLEVMRHVGRAASAIRAERAAVDPLAEKRAKLGAALGPRRKSRVTTEGFAPTTSRPVATTRSAATPSTPSIDGVVFGPDGHLADPGVWTAELGERIATMLGVELDAARWVLVNAARADFEKTGAAPNIRRLTQETKLATKDVYALFPRAPGRTIAKIAGIPKPVGCI